jgi:hypothetical protein
LRRKLKVARKPQKMKVFENCSLWTGKKKVKTFAKIKIATKIYLSRKDMITSMGHVHHLMK